MVLIICEISLGFNRGTQLVKQTGSSMKPLAVVAPSIDKGIITAATVFDDNPTTFNNGTDAAINVESLIGVTGIIKAVDKRYLKVYYIRTDG